MRSLEPWKDGQPMKKSKFPEQRIAFALQQAEGGMQVADRWRPGLSAAIDS